MSASTRAIVIAVGGNALIKDPKKISVEDQAEAVQEACERIASLVEEGYTPIITHGNGPQVGFLLRRAELAQGELPPLPLDVLGADTQGATGYLFSRSLRNCLARRGIRREVAAVVTQTVVDPQDPAFASPSKPVGSFMTEAEAHEHQERDGWDVREDAGRGWRRVVPSPSPVEIIERDVVKTFVDSGSLVIVCGGGGIPVRRQDDELIGVEAVIDKDLASALLASRLGVKDLVICTAVDQVCLNFNTPDQRALDTMTVEEARSHLADGQFGAGSMAPKIESALSFLAEGGERAIITSLEALRDALEGNAGTRITH